MKTKWDTRKIIKTKRIHQYFARFLLLGAYVVTTLGILKFVGKYPDYENLKVLAWLNLTYGVTMLAVNEVTYQFNLRNEDEFRTHDVPVISETEFE